MENNLEDEIAARGSVKTRTEYALAWTLLKGLGLLPRRVALAAGQTIAFIAQHILPRLARHADVNLQLAFPQLSERSRAQLRRATFVNLGRLLGEVSQFPRLSPENISNLVVYEGLENYLTAKARGNGVLLLTGHIGAWELSSFAHSIYGYRLSFLKRKIDNPLVERLVESYRSRFGNSSIDKRGSLRDVIRTLKEGGVVGILADLNTTREEGVFVDFFGLLACTTAGVAMLAQRTGAAVLPGYIVWDEAAGVHRLCFEPSIETVNTGDRKADTVNNTARYTQALERIIRRYPDQWLWIHRRWRTRPQGEPSLY